MISKMTRFGVLVTVVLAWACSSSTPPGVVRCDTDADCPDGLVCGHGACHRPCAGPADCPEGEECRDGACIVPCASKADCPVGYQCGPDGVCIPETVDVDGGPDGDADGGACIDRDQDGYGDGCALGRDCDDNDRAIHPGAIEDCQDGVDNNCNGLTDGQDPDCHCQRGEQRECYDGPADTEGRGVCHGGVAVCRDDGTFGACQGQVLPAASPETVCNGRDDDCNGQTDEGLLNRCGRCSPPDDQLSEQCGNGLDDNCDGTVDENCNCDPNCQCDPQNPGHNCVCHPPTDQPCYSGPVGTLGFGDCRGGVHDCVEQPGGGYAWTTCEGEVLPSEECAGGAADGKDNDCDGMTDEDCLPDRDGDSYSPPQDCDDNDPEVHPGAAEACNGRDDDCDRLVDEGVQNACGGCGAVGDEVCGDGLDNDCDGEVDDGCGGCLGSEIRPCYRGPPGTEDKGICRMGEMQCDGEYWGPCQGDVLPEPESCNQLDDDCDGETDERWAIGSNPCGYCHVDETCDGQDNDCDGLTDEGLRNACGDCLPVPEETVCNDRDDDCDGLTDEGLLNACGTCGDSCFEQSWGGPGHGDQWSQGTADGVSNNTDPDSLMLDSTTLSPHFIWIAGTTTLCTAANGCLSNPGCYPGEDCHVVRKFDTRTNQLMGIYSSWGWSPSRTAVAVDNTVWVGNRGCHDNLSNCDSDNPMHGNAAHLDADGNLICRADVTCGTDGVAVRAVTIDKAGHAWLGCWQDGHIYQYSGSEVDTAQNPPRCVRLRDVNLGGSRAYGAAVDGNGFLWIATLNNGALKKINTATGEIVMSVSPGVQTYGVAVDQNNNVWLGNWSGGAIGVVRVNGSTGEYTLVPRTQGTLNGQSRGVAVDQRGNIWVAEWSNRSVSKYAPDGTHLGQYALGTGANGPLGMAVDFDNNIWAIAYSSGHASKFDFEGNHLATFSVGSAPYTYSDMTGYQLRTVTLKHGTWTVDFDSGYAGAQWDSVTWGGALAADDQIRIRARSAATQGGLATAAWSPYHDTDFNQPSPWTASLQGEIPRGRWVQIEVTLSTQDDVSPVFSSLVVHWQY